jgi:ribonuclease BN (tRNA processing enzyme)
LIQAAGAVWVNSGVSLDWAANPAEARVPASRPPARQQKVSGYLDRSDDLVRLERRTLDHRRRTPLPVYGADGLQVTALGVTHGSVPALAYRVEYGGRSLVFSGDQNGDDAQFVDFARGADLLVMAHAVPEDTGPVAARLHALPSEIGTIARGAGVKHLLLSHLMRRSEQTLDQSLGIIRSRYPGPTTIAEDLLCLEP